MTAKATPETREGLDRNSIGLSVLLDGSQFLGVVPFHLFFVIVPRAGFCVLWEHLDAFLAHFVREKGFAEQSAEVKK